MSFFDDEEDLHEEGLCDPAFCRFCEMERDEGKNGSSDDIDDEPLWSDTQTAIERVNSIKGR